MASGGGTDTGLIARVGKILCKISVPKRCVVVQFTTMLAVLFPPPSFPPPESVTGVAMG